MVSSTRWRSLSHSNIAAISNAPHSHGKLRQTLARRTWTRAQRRGQQVDAQVADIHAMRLQAEGGAVAEDLIEALAQDRHQRQACSWVGVRRSWRATKYSRSASNGV